MMGVLYNIRNKMFLSFSTILSAVIYFGTLSQSLTSFSHGLTLGATAQNGGVRAAVGQQLDEGAVARRDDNDHDRTSRFLVITTGLGYSSISEGEQSFPLYRLWLQGNFQAKIRAELAFGGITANKVHFRHFDAAFDADEDVRSAFLVGPPRDEATAPENVEHVGRFLTGQDLDGIRGQWAGALILDFAHAFECVSNGWPVLGGTGSNDDEDRANRDQPKRPWQETQIPVAQVAFDDWFRLQKQDIQFEKHLFGFRSAPDQGGDDYQVFKVLQAVDVAAHAVPDAARASRSGIGGNESSLVVEANHPERRGAPRSSVVAPHAQIDDDLPAGFAPSKYRWLATVDPVWDRSNIKKRAEKAMAIDDTFFENRLKALEGRAFVHPFGRSSVATSNFVSDDHPTRHGHTVVLVLGTWAHRSSPDSQREGRGRHRAGGGSCFDVRVGRGRAARHDLLLRILLPLGSSGGGVFRDDCFFFVSFFDN